MFKIKVMIMSNQASSIDGYKVCKWLNTETMKEVYGMKVRVGLKWYLTGVDGVLTTFETKEAARKALDALKIKVEAKALEGAM